MPLEVTGLKDLDNALAHLPDRMAKTALRKAVRAAANKIKNEAKSRAPGKTIRRSIAVRRADTKGTDQYTVTDDIGVNLRIAPHWHWFEFGIPHSWKISTKRKRSLYSEDIEKFFGKEVEHPPLPARPFLRPAVAAAGPAAIETLRRALAQAIMIEVGKLAGKGKR